MAHFFYIHYGLPTYFKNVFEGHIASQYLHNVGRPDIGGMGTQYGEAHLDSEASYFGPSFMINWLHNDLAPEFTVEIALIILIVAWLMYRAIDRVTDISR